MSQRREPDLEKLEAAAVRANRLSTLVGHPGWEEMTTMLREQQEQWDRTTLAKARSGTLTERDIHWYEGISYFIKTFSAKPGEAQTKLETLLRKVQQAQPDEGT